MNETDTTTLREQLRAAATIQAFTTAHDMAPSQLVKTEDAHGIAAVVNALEPVIRQIVAAELRTHVEHCERMADRTPLGTTSGGIVRGVYLSEVNRLSARVAELRRDGHD